MQGAVTNAEVSAQHLEQILDANPGKPILLIENRMPWHRRNPIRDVPQANLRWRSNLYFPVVAPELNAQEHRWKAGRRVISHDHTIPRLAELADRLEQHLLANTFESSFLERYAFDAVCAISN
jgi:hypothetical protein